MRYRTGEAFRKALEARLNTRPESLVRSRKLVTFERFVARIQAGGDTRWVLKGGFALQLRLGDHPRTTKDVDLSADPAIAGQLNLGAADVGEMLAEAAARDQDDHFGVEVGMCHAPMLEVGPVRAFRYPVHGLLGGRTFERFHVDAGFGDPIVSPPVELPGSGRLDFAELAPVTFRSIALDQQFAEKIHALTRPRQSGENTRTHDLADLMLLLDLGLPAVGTVRSALRAVFEARRTHPLPRRIGDPPRAWLEEYRALAEELRLEERTLERAMARLRQYWETLAWPDE